MERRWEAVGWGGTAQWSLVPFALPAPGPGEVSIRVHAAGVNPADLKHVLVPRAGATLPIPIGYEVSGTIIAIGRDTEIGSGPVAVGDEVLAFRVQGGYATALTVPAEKVFTKPHALSHPEAANLLLAGTTAAEMLAVTEAKPGETILLHGASGAVGVAVMQLAALQGVTVVGTASARSAERVRAFGGIPTPYGAGLVERVRSLTDAPIAAALDAVGTAEAITTSLELVVDRSRIVTIAAAPAAREHGLRAIAGSMPDSAAFRDAARANLIDLAAADRLVVPLAKTFPIADAIAATDELAKGHPGGKFALVP